MTISDRERFLLLYKEHSSMRPESDNVEDRRIWLIELRTMARMYCPSLTDEDFAELVKESAEFSLEIVEHYKRKEEFYEQETDEIEKKEQALRDDY